jgi:hypothetical protein
LVDSAGAQAWSVAELLRSMLEDISAARPARRITARTTSG